MTRRHDSFESSAERPGQRPGDRAAGDAASQGTRRDAGSGLVGAQDPELFLVPDQPLTKQAWSRRCVF